MPNSNLGRDRLDWSDDVWQTIDTVVHDEAKRTKVAARFLPLFLSPDALTVSADAVLDRDSALLQMGEGAVIPLVEIWSEFALTQKQIEQERTLHTAATLATAAGNALSRAEDLLVFNGQEALHDPLFKSGRVRHRRDMQAGKGLLEGSAADVVTVDPTEEATDPNFNEYGENTFRAVARAYAELQRSHGGRFALVLHTTVYADAYAPLKSTLVMPADRIKGLVGDLFYGTDTVPPLEGFLAALDGSTMDLAIGTDTVTAFLQINDQGLFLFRVFERFALRLKDPSSVVKLQFNKAKAGARPAAAKAKASV